MYLIFERESGIFQFSFCNYKEIIFIRGFIIYQIEDKIFTCNKRYFIFLNELPLKSTQVLDYRFVFKNNIFKEIIYFFFYIIFLIYKSVRKFLDSNYFIKIFTWMIVFIILFDVSNQKETSVVNYNQNQHDFLTWKNHFIKNKTSQKISLKKHSFLNDKIPQIRGIWDFKVIPLTTQAHTDDSYSGFIALPYSSVISIQGNFSSIKKPIENCQDMGLRVFAISERDELLLLESNKLISQKRKDHFFLFSILELKKYAQYFPNYCEYIMENSGENF